MESWKTNALKLAEVEIRGSGLQRDKKEMIGTACKQSASREPGDRKSGERVHEHTLNAELQRQGLRK